VTWLAGALLLGKDFFDAFLSLFRTTYSRDTARSIGAW